MILGLAHAALVVPDLERAIDFYSRMFGFETRTPISWQQVPEIDRAIGLEASAARSVMLAGHNCFLELFEYSAPKPVQPVEQNPAANQPGFRHLAFYVDDVPAEYERLIALGGQRLGEPLTNRIGRQAVYARDPFGNLIELCQPFDDGELLTRLPGVDREGDFTGANAGEDG